MSNAGMQMVQEGLVVRRLGHAALAGLALFVGAALAVHALRGDLDWQRAPLSFYLLGAHGDWLRAAYFALTATLAGLGIGVYAALEKSARSAAPLLLFAIAAVALCTTAVADSHLPGRAPTLEGLVHGVAAQTAFLCVTTAMLLQSWRMRLDAAWRHRFARAFALAVVAFAALWGHALWSAAPRGITQRVVVALVLLWLALVAGWLGRRRVA
jgi:hypothetical protein